MAKSSWLTVSPTSGFGNKTIQNIGTSHTGRLDRQTVVTGRAIGISTAKTYTVTQKAKSEFITIGATSYSVANTGGIVTISGTSNSPKLTVSVGSGGTLGTLVVNGSTVTNGAAISGDPGATAQYSWSIQIQVGENLTAVQRAINVSVTGSSASVADTVQIVQAASVFEYEFTPSASVATIAASGGNSVITAQLKTYRNGSLVSTRAVTPTLSGSATGFSISGTTVTAANRGTTVGEARSIIVTCNYVTAETKETVSGTVTVTQAANSRVIVYGKPTITSFEVADIPASGGSVSSGDVEYSQSRHYYYDSGQTEELSPLTTGGQVTFGDAVSARSLGTNIKSRTIVGQLTCQVAMNGQTSVEVDASVYQQENTFISWDIPHPLINLPNSGERDIIFRRLTWNWTSGHYNVMDSRYLDDYQIMTEIESDLIDDVYGGVNGNYDYGSFEFYNVGVVPNETSSFKSGVLYLNITSTDFSIFDHTEEFDVTQSKGTQTYSEITVNLSYPQASAAGGTVNPILTYSQTWGWNGSTTGGGTITSGASVSYSGTNINTSTGAATVASKGTTVSGVTTATTATVTVSMNGKTAQKSAAVQQVANERTETGRTISLSAPEGDIDAGGGTKNLTSSGVINYSFTSGTTSTGSFTPTLSISGTGFTLDGKTVTAANRTTTVGDRRTCTVTASYSGATSKTVTIGQEANAATYGNVTLTANNPSTVVATGGTATISASASQTVSFTSGSTRAGSVSIAYNEKSVVSGFTLSGNEVTVGANSSTSVRSYVVTVTATGEGGKSATKDVTVSQAAGARTYSAITLNVSYPTIPAKGGTVTPIVIYSQTWGWNGSTTGGGTITSGGTITYSGTSVSTSNGAVIAGTKGTTVSGVTTVTNATVQVTLNGKTASKQVAVQQQANSATYGNVTISGGSVSDIPASGGSVSEMSGISGSQTVSFTSESTRPGSVSITYGTKVEADSLGTTIKNRTSVGTLTATATGEGSKSATKSLTVYQAGNYVTAIDLTGFAVSYSKSVSASGGTVSPSVTGGSVKFTFTSGGTTTTTPSSTYGSLSSAVSYSGSAANGFSAPNSLSGSMTASDRATTVGAARNSGTVTATKEVTWTPTSSYNSAGTKTDSMSDTDYATQEANVATSRVEYGNITNIALSTELNFQGNGGAVYGEITADETVYTYTDYTSGDSVLTDTETVQLSRLNASAEVSSSDSWIEASMTNTTTFEVNVTENPNSSPRSGSVTFTIYSDDSGNEGSQQFIVSQDAASYLNVNPTSLSFEAAGGTKSITIDTNESWTIS